MTAEEFKNEFLLEYDSHASNSAPGHSDYTISYWLTTAQEELVKDYLDPRSNRIQRSFEEVEKRRVKLQALVKPAVFNYNTALAYNPSINITSDSLIFNTSSLEVLEIKQEHLVTDPQKCLGLTELPVVPLLLDEYNDMKRNPFRRPSNWRAWRLNTGAYNPTINSIELLSELPFISYNIRYVKRPRPIIIENLVDGFTINGQTAQQTSELDDSMHREIISRAVVRALETVMSPRFQSRAALDQMQVE
jgi:hypothetical protein